MQICNYRDILPTKERGGRSKNTLLDSHRSNPDSPAWLPEEWWSYWRPIWQTTKDVYEGLEDYQVRQLYLYKKTGERDQRYNTRVYTSYLDNFFRDAVDGYAGLISNFELPENPPELIEELAKNVDGMGTSLKKFMIDVDQMILRDDCCFIAVDTFRPKTPEEQRLSRKPYLVAIDIRDVYAPAKSFDGMAYRLDQIAIKRSVIEKDGDFGTRTKNQFWVYRPGLVEIWDEDSENGFVQTDIFPLLNAKGEPHRHIPLVWYSASGAPLLEPNEPPFLRLLRVNLVHMNKVSELDTAESMVNSITPYRTWPDNVPDPSPNQKFGDDVIIDVEGGGNVGMLEAKGNGTVLTQERIKNREEKMKELSYSFLGDRTTPKTATETLMDEGKMKVSLEVVAENKSTTTKEVFRHVLALGDSTYDFDNPQSDIEGVVVSEEAIRVPPSAQDVMVIIKGFIDGAYSRKFMFEKLKEIGWNPESINIQEELSFLPENGLNGEILGLEIDPETGEVA